MDYSARIHRSAGRGFRAFHTDSVPGAPVHLAAGAALAYPARFHSTSHAMAIQRVISALPAQGSEDKGQPSITPTSDVCCLTSRDSAGESMTLGTIVALASWPMASMNAFTSDFARRLRSCPRSRAAGHRRPQGMRGTGISMVPTLTPR
jgi:hypothetical protein